MGIQINGQTDIISATDGNLTISGADLPTVTNLNATGIVTATTFSGALTGNVTGNLTGNVTGNINSSGVSTVTTLNATTISGVSTIGVTTATVTTLTVNGNAYPSAGPLSNRNLIINGAMQVAQRGTSFTVAHDGTQEAYTLDRFYFASSNLDSWDGTVTQDSDAPAGFSNSLKITTLTSESTVDSNEYAYLQQRIEAQNLQHIKNGASGALPLKLSFWIKTSQTGTYGFAIYKDDNTARCITSTYTTTTTDWEYKTIDIPGDTGGGGIDSNNGVGIRLYFPFISGSDYTSTDSTNWINYVSTGLFYGHAQNATATTASATWQITGVQLEVGTVATPFEHRSYGEELALCQRYYEKFTADDNNGGYATLCKGGKSTNTIIILEPVFRVPKRAPGATVSWGGNFRFGGPSGVYNSLLSSIINAQLGTHGGYIVLTTSSAVNPSNGDYSYRFEGNGDTSAYIAFSSEL